MRWRGSNKISPHSVKTNLSAKQNCREEGLSAQQAQEAVAAAAAAQDRLTEALAAIRSLVEAAEESAMEALDSLALEENGSAPVRKGSAGVAGNRLALEREIGNDGRICDLIDSQINAIEGACGEIASINPLVAFDVIERQLAEFAGSETAPASPQAAAEDSPSAAAPPAPSDEMLAALVEPLETVAETAASAPADDSEAAVRASSVLAEEAIATAEAEAVMVETTDVPAEIVEAMDGAAGPEGPTAEAAEAAEAQNEAHDDAILDMIALEMAADGPTDVDDVAEMTSAEIAVAELAPADPVSVAPEPEPEPIAAAAEPPAVETPPQAAEEPSLGASLISRGILSRPQVATADPLAPIRRMSQAEKIALFS